MAARPTTSRVKGSQDRRGAHANFLAWTSRSIAHGHCPSSSHPPPACFLPRIPPLCRLKAVKSTRCELRCEQGLHEIEGPLSGQWTGLSVVAFHLQSWSVGPSPRFSSYEHKHLKQSYCNTRNDRSERPAASSQRAIRRAALRPPGGRKPIASTHDITIGMRVQPGQARRAKKGIVEGLLHTNVRRHTCCCQNHTLAESWKRPCRVLVFCSTRWFILSVVQPLKPSGTASGWHGKGGEHMRGHGRWMRA